MSIESSYHQTFEYDDMTNTYQTYNQLRTNWAWLLACCQTGLVISSVQYQLNILSVCPHMIIVISELLKRYYQVTKRQFWNYNASNGRFMIPFLWNYHLFLKSPPISGEHDGGSSTSGSTITNLTMICQPYGSTLVSIHLIHIATLATDYPRSCYFAMDLVAQLAMSTWTTAGPTIVCYYRLPCIGRSIQR